MGNTLFVCFDIDSKTTEARTLFEWLSRWFRARGVTFVQEDTGGRGLHGWALFKCYVPAIKAIGLANFGLASYETEVRELPCPIEVFPKQGKLREGEVGNCIRLPLGKHGLANFSHFLPDNEAAIRAIKEGRKFTEFDIDKILPEWRNRMALFGIPSVMVRP